MEQRRHTQLQRRAHLWEPTHLGKAGAELHEVVVGLLDGVTNEVVHDIADVLQMPGRDDAALEVLAIRDVAQRVLDAGQLVLLDHVVEQVPPQVAPVVIWGCGRRKAEERRFDSDHS